MPTFPLDVSGPFPSILQDNWIQWLKDKDPMERWKAYQKEQYSPRFGEQKAFSKVWDWHWSFKKEYLIPFDTDICRADAY